MAFVASVSGLSSTSVIVKRTITSINKITLFLVGNSEQCVFHQDPNPDPGLPHASH